MTDNETVQVLPNLSNSRSSRRREMPREPVKVPNIDPDVEAITKPKKSILDIMGLKHEPTDEESKSKKEDTKDTKDKYPWLLIALAVVVVLLIIVLVWYVLRENENNEKSLIPKEIMQPFRQAFPQPQKPPPQQQPQYQQPQYQQQPPQQQQFMQQQYNKNQTERLPIQTNSMKSAPKPKPSSKPTKSELEATLSKLDTIPEKKTKKTEEVADDELEEDMKSKFYNSLQKNVELDEHDSDEEEGRSD